VLFTGEGVDTTMDERCSREATRRGYAFVPAPNRTAKPIVEGPAFGALERPLPLSADDPGRPPVPTFSGVGVSAGVYAHVGVGPQRLRAPAHYMTRVPRAAPRRVAYGSSEAHFKGISGDIAKLARALLKDRSLPEFELQLNTSVALPSRPERGATFKELRAYGFLGFLAFRFSCLFRFFGFCFLRGFRMARGCVMNARGSSCFWGPEMPESFRPVGGCAGLVARLTRSRRC
jgi:hypothetical protein